ncbi:zinc-binding dehydrogenase [Levilactobacillus huananensis]|uniref:zinc-binding dehydrogenase n=1 Tax=Levilactobacillus huananensis TaxID=2486019 RepID=UPI001CDBD6CC|nr:zinc-binding dehydrogenase [Levilactobacillus huananensis]
MSRGQDLVDEMFDLITRNHLEIPIAKIFKLADIREAHDYVMVSRELGQVISDND